MAGQEIRGKKPEGHQQETVIGSIYTYSAPASDVFCWYVFL